MRRVTTRSAARFAAACALALGGAAALGRCGEPAPSPRLPGWGPACVSGRYWGRGEDGDNHMHPGRACINCHEGRHRGPRFTVAGTVYSRLHEEDDCLGASATTYQVEVVDSSNVPFFITPNAAGNFYTTHPFRLPLQQVRVHAPDGGVSEMNSAPPHGDCNACHTRAGLDSVVGTTPGRVVAP